MMNNLFRNSARYKRKIVNSIFNYLFKKRLYPSISNYWEIARFQTTDSDELIHKILKKSGNLETEFDTLSQNLKYRIARAKNLAYPLNFGLETKQANFIYKFVRLYKPKQIVETGVANGVSTYFILNAMKKNGVGKLISIDINKNVGGLLAGNEKTDWRLYILNKKSSKKSLVKTLNEIKNRNVSIFLHDSNHSYNWQLFEYENALKILKPKIIMSDDIDNSLAFYYFCKKTHKNPYILIDRRKFFGVLEIKN